MTLFRPFFPAGALLALVACAVAAAPRAEPGAEELIRQANAAFTAGDGEAADRLYRAAEEMTTDPGLVAFNRGAVLFQLGQFREAELQYRCVLDDRACPPERAARAWYNRGTCLLRRGGSTGVLREAIGDLEKCIASPAADDPLKADARYNLELAKLLWTEMRKKNAKPESPNDPPSDDPLSNPPNPNGNDPATGTPEPGDSNTTGGNLKPVPQTQAPSAEPKDNPGAKTDPGAASHLQPLQDTSVPQPMTPEDTREHLKRAAERIKKDRRDLLKTLTGPDRPGLLDW